MSHLDRRLYGVGDMIWAYRKPYHSANENVCTEKFIRPFVILALNDNQFLVLPMSSKNKNGAVKYNDSYIVTEEYYKIDRKDIVSRLGYCPLLKDLIKRAYYNLNSPFNKTPNEIKKWLLVEFNKYYMLEKEYNVGDKIVTFNEHTDYVIDSVKKDGVYAFKLHDNDKVDFSNSEYISNSEIYKTSGRFDIKVYLTMRNDLYNQSYNEKEEKKNNLKRSEKKKNSFYISMGSIIRFEEKILFVIDCGKSTLLCIPYNDDYKLNGLVKVKKDKERIKFIRNLSPLEILPILKELSKNIHVAQDSIVQNYILRYQFEHKSL